MQRTDRGAICLSAKPALPLLCRLFVPCPCGCGTASNAVLPRVTQSGAYGRGPYPTMLTALFLPFPFPPKVSLRSTHVVLLVSFISEN